MSTHQQAHKRRRDAAYERGRADAIEEAAKVAETYIGGEHEAQGRAAEEIVADIRKLRSAG